MSSCCPDNTATSISPGRAFLPSLSTQRHFVDEVPDDLQCPLCYENAISCSTACRHSFCWYCFHNYYKSSVNPAPPCPMCRNPISPLLVRRIDGEIGERVGKLIVACRAFQEGCDATGPLSWMEEHEVTCMHTTVTCYFLQRGCDFVVKREHMEKHINRCRYNPLVSPCKYEIYGCKTRGTEKLLAKHQYRCSKRTMGEFVSCRNKVYGCGLKVKKFYLEKHHQTCLFRPEVKSSDNKNYAIEISFSWKDQTKKHRKGFAQLKKQLSKLFPNISSLYDGPFRNEFQLLLQNMPLEALKGLNAICDPSISTNLDELNIMRKGVNAFLENQKDGVDLNYAMIRRNGSSSVCTD